MTESEALEMFERLSRAIKRPPNQTKRQVRTRNAIARHESPNMRTVGRQTRDPIKAIYDNGGLDRSPTPTVDPDKVTWWDKDFHVIEYRAGKSTQTRQ